jgi:hypothetical protein
MIRLNMIVEGQTEEAFVHAVLEEQLATRQVFVAVRCVETSRDKKRHQVFRGGMLAFRRAREDLERWMKEDQRPEAWFTTLFDLYALPDDFPQSEEARTLRTPVERVTALEEAFRQVIGHPRFIPHLQLHEFEALLLVDPSKFDWEFIEHAEAIDRLIALAASFASPEEIDEGKDTAPSKRIIREIPEYQFRKASAGPLIASKIGLPLLRQKCPHFHGWLAKLEALGVIPHE